MWEVDEHLGASPAPDAFTDRISAAFTAVVRPFYPSLEDKLITKWDKELLCLLCALRTAPACVLGPQQRVPRGKGGCRGA